MARNANIIRNVEFLSQTEMRNSVAENPQEYGPLIRELFDMKG